MPITIRHTPVGTLGRLAVLAGQVRGQQLKMARDIQWASLAQAGARQAVPTRLAVDRRREPFAIQRAGADRIAREQPVTPDTAAMKRKLQKFVSDAKAAGIYEPAQIKQMQIFADLGDEQAVRSIASRLPRPLQPTAKRRELGEQTKALEELRKSSVTQVQQQLDIVNKELGKRFSPGIQQLLRTDPKFMETVDQETQERLTLQQQYEDQIAQINNRLGAMKHKVQMGITIPEQMEFERRQEAQLTKEETAEQRRLEQRAGALSEREELVVDMIRDKERDQRTAISREIIELSKDLVQFENEKEDEYADRIGPINGKISQLNLLRNASYAGEKAQIEEFLKSRQQTPKITITDAAGQRWRFTGRYRDGKPIYEEIE